MMKRLTWEEKLKLLGMSKAELCRRLDLHPNTPYGWRGGVAPGYAEAYLDAMLENRRLRIVMATGDDPAGGAQEEEPA